MHPLPVSPRSALRVHAGALLLLLATTVPTAAVAQAHVALPRLGLGCQFATITAAIAAAIPGDTILVKQGITFNESVSFAQNVAIRSAGPNCFGLSPQGAPKPRIVAPNLAVAVDMPAGSTGALERIEVVGNGVDQAIRIDTGATLTAADVIVRGGGLGGITVRGGTLKLIGRSSVRNNSAGPGAVYQGGGISARDGATVNVSGDSAIEDNAALGGNGGGIYAIGRSVVSLTGRAVVRRNSDGGVRVSDSTLWLRDDALIGGVGAGNAAYHGAGVYLSATEAPATAILTGRSRIQGNLGNQGGGIYAVSTSPALAATVVLRDTALIGGDLPGEGNTAQQSGGGMTLWATNGAVTLVADAGTRIVGNSAGVSGGGVHAADAQVTLAGEVGANQAAVDGGGVYLECQGNPQSMVVSGPVRANQAGGSGGGIGAIHSGAGACKLTLRAADVVDNRSGGPGGGIGLAGSVTLDAQDAWIQRNAASAGGGVAAAAVGGAGPTLAWSTSAIGLQLCSYRIAPPPGFNQYCFEVRDNTANEGAGVHLSAGSADLQNVVFIGNDAAADASGLLLRPAGGAVSATVRNVLFAGNSATHGATVVRVGAGAQLRAAHLTLADNLGTPIAWDALSGGYLRYSLVADAANMVVDPALVLNARCNGFNGVSGSVAGAGNTYGLNPGFVTNPLRGDYRLDSSSTNSIDKCNGSSPEDLDNNPRPVGPKWDKGAFEAQ